MKGITLRATAFLLMLLVFCSCLAGCQSTPDASTDHLDAPQTTGSANGNQITDPAPSGSGIENPPFDWNMTTKPTQKGEQTTTQKTNQGNQQTAATGQLPSSFSQAMDNQTTTTKASQIKTNGQNVTSSTTQKATQPTQKPVTVSGRVKAVWISQYDISPILKGKSKTAFSASFEAWCKAFAQKGINTLVIQVRPFGDALYPSNYFPWSHYVTGTQGQNPGFDPLEIMIATTQKYNLRVHAWVNPYRVWVSALGKVPANNPFYQRDDVVEISGSYYFNPASASARQLILNGVAELATNYAIAGVHFDDYFYPTQNASFDAAAFSAYQKAGGKLSLAAWRKEQVNTLVKEAQKIVHQKRPGCQFGISPAGALVGGSTTIKTVDELYADVYAWVEGGWVDYLCPQIYFGYQNAASPYAKTLGVWSNLAGNKVDLWAGLPLYKCGAEDKWAGAGKQEFLNNNDLMKRMTTDAFADKVVDGVCFFDTASFLTPANAQMQKEVENLSALLISVQ